MARTLMEKSATFSVPPGIWSISASAPGFFVESRIVDSSQKVGGPVVMTAWPVGTIHGTLSKPPADAASDVRDVIAYFSPARHSEGTPPIDSSVACTVAKDRSFACSLPAGSWDVRLNPSEFVPRFLHNLSVTSGQATPLGIVKLIPGLSLSGGVAFRNPPERATKKIGLALVPAGNDRQTGVSTATADRDGFFQFTGLVPGQYELTARAGELMSTVIDVVIRPGKHAVLRDPVELLPPMTAEVDVAPPADPSGKPWTVEIVGSSRRGVRVVAAGAVDPSSGLARFFPLQQTGYEIDLRDSSHALWTSKRVGTGQKIEPAEEIHVHFDAGPVQVSGLVHVGDRRIPTKLYFMTDRKVPGTTRGVPVASDEHGYFSGTVPPQSGDKWLIGIENHDLGLSREVVEPVKVENGEAHLDIDLPGTILTGKVVDADGRPVSGGASVNIEATFTESAGAGLAENQEFVQANVDSEGKFLFIGLEPGEYQVEAEAGSRGRTPRRTIQVEPAPAENRLTLKLEPAGTLQGRVVAGNAGVAGALVYAWPMDSYSKTYAQNRTDADGRFTIVSVGTPGEPVGVMVQAPGAGFKMFRMALSDEPIEIPLDPSPGTLTIHAPSGVNPLVMHHGMIEWAGIIAIDGYGTWDRNNGMSTLRVEPGEYIVCAFPVAMTQNRPWSTIVPDQTCAQGYVGPFGTLDLFVDSNDRRATPGN